MTKKVLKPYERWARFSKRVERLALDILKTSKVSSPNGAADPSVIAYLLLIRTITNTRGVRALIGRKLVVEARILARNCVENFLWIGALVKDPIPFVKKMRDNDLKHKKLLGHRLLSVSSEDEKKNLTSLKKTLKALAEEWPDVKTITPVDVAESGDLFQAYVFYSQLCMDSAHPTTDALSRYLVKYEVNGQSRRGYTIHPPAKKPIERTETMWFAAWALMGLCVGVNQLNKGDAKFNKRLLLLERAYHQLYEDTLKV